MSCDKPMFCLWCVHALLEVVAIFFNMPNFKWDDIVEVYFIVVL